MPVPSSRYLHSCKWVVASEAVSSLEQSHSLRLERILALCPLRYTASQPHEPVLSSTWFRLRLTLRRMLLVRQRRPSKLGEDGFCKQCTNIRARRGTSSCYLVLVPHLERFSFFLGGTRNCGQASERFESGVLIDHITRIFHRMQSPGWQGMHRGCALHSEQQTTSKLPSSLIFSATYSASTRIRALRT